MRMTRVNFAFITVLEGGTALHGYVPDAVHSQSGVTIATGFDLGQRSVDELTQLLPQPLVQKLAPYCHLKKQSAIDALCRFPLELTHDEAEVIDLNVKHQMLAILKKRYDRASAIFFCMLPEQAQTVIASVAFQYGDLAKRCPRFWGFAVTQNWAAMESELREFGDRYSTRRIREANYLSVRSE
ncbi:pesticin C-terminus-like muramidase [Shewanella marina]|uniref:pesticin C-terminus-like muramidase n=1 Tax=Shewanella marina TaxID=487319 RepID=UPI00046FD272|nr:pesticin C-terminus-like muramidase [Shewanella marina]